MDSLSSYYQKGFRLLLRTPMIAFWLLVLHGFVHLVNFIHLYDYLATLLYLVFSIFLLSYPFAVAQVLAQNAQKPNEKAIHGVLRKTALRLIGPFVGLSTIVLAALAVLLFVVIALGGKDWIAVWISNTSTLMTSLSLGVWFFAIFTAFAPVIFAVEKKGLFASLWGSVRFTIQHFLLIVPIVLWETARWFMLLNPYYMQFGKTYRLFAFVESAIFAYVSLGVLYSLFFYYTHHRPKAR